MPDVLNAVPFPGIRPDTLGGYLSGLGLLSAAAQKWPAIRGCWRDGHFMLCASQLQANDVAAFLHKDWQPTPYRRWWKGQKLLGPVRAKALLNEVRLLDAHIVSRLTKNVYNPVFGTGGNVGKRDFAKVADSCRALRNHDRASEWLEATLWNRLDVTLPELPSTGTWFVQANKTFNSGMSISREGQLSPWSWMLALEGALLLSGSINRLLSATARPYGAFPFVTEGAAPVEAGELGTVRAEFWAPDWDQPARLVEVSAFLQRGLARVGHRAARTPADFAAAALTAGAQMGITGFQRFSLRQTTSGNTYEAVRAAHVSIDPNRLQPVLVNIANWLDRLPRDEVSSGNSKFVGLRGPVEQGILKVAENPGNPEYWRGLLAATSGIQMKLDRNRSIRDKKSVLCRLPNGVFDAAWPTPDTAVLLARSLASVGLGEYALFHNIYGVEPGSKYFGKDRTPSAVWHSGDPLEVMAGILHRRLVDTGKFGNPDGQLALGSPCPASPALVDQFLRSPSLPEQVVQLLPALSLINWRKAIMHPTPLERPTPEYRLQALFRPLFLAGPANLGPDPSTSVTLEPHPARSRAILALIRAEEWQRAVDLARQAYASVGIQIVLPPAVSAHGSRIAATLLIPVAPDDSCAEFLDVWARPRSSYKRRTKCL